MEKEIKSPKEIKLYEHIRGKDIITLSDDKREPLIEGMLYPMDYVMLVAEEKMGKTILTQQLALCMSCGQPFLGIFNIPKPLKVLYFATEGKRDDLKDRFIRMHHHIEADFDNIVLTPTYFSFNTDRGEGYLKEAVADLGDFKPDVIIVDAIYRAVSGELTKDAIINAFHQQMARLQKRFECAIILVHHMTKPTRNQFGEFNTRSDKDTYGSAFLLAAIDHVFRLEKWRGKEGEDNKLERLLKCDTQRGGNIIESVRLHLEQPDPLYFVVVSKHENEKHRIIEVLKSMKGTPLNIDQIMKKTKIGRSTIFVILKETPEIKKIGTNNRTCGYIYDTFISPSAKKSVD